MLVCRVWGSYVGVWVYMLVSCLLLLLIMWFCCWFNVGGLLVCYLIAI